MGIPFYILIAMHDNLNSPHPYLYLVLSPLNFFLASLISVLIYIVDTICNSLKAKILNIFSCIVLFI